MAEGSSTAEAVLQGRTVLQERTVLRERTVYRRGELVLISVSEEAVWVERWLGEVQVVQGEVGEETKLQ